MDQANTTSTPPPPPPSPPAPVPIQDHFRGMAQALSRQIADALPGSAVLVLIAASRVEEDGNTLATPSAGSLVNRHRGAQACACMDAVIEQLREYIDTVAEQMGLDPATLRRDLLGDNAIEKGEGSNED